MSKNPYIGSTLEDFLKEDGVLEEVTAVVVKRTLALQVEKAMKAKELSRSKMAKLMGTSRAALNRFLDPENPSVTLLTIEKAARALDKNVHIQLADTINS